MSILDGVSTTAVAVVGPDDSDNDDTHQTSTNHVVMISTGVGIGPCVGALEMALLLESNSEFPPIELYAS